MDSRWPAHVPHRHCEPPHPRGVALDRRRDAPVTVERSESEFAPGDDVTLYRIRAAKTDSYVRAHALDQPSLGNEDVSLRWIVLQLINESARHAGHADATRELLDGTVGE